MHFLNPLFESLSYPIGYLSKLGKGYIVSLREQMREIGATLWIEDAWTPHFTRERD